jgi:flagellin-specific chaperone FliS
MDRAYTPSEAVARYTANQVTGASAGQLLLQLFDLTIGACRRGDAPRAKQGLGELMGSLNLDYLEVSGPLFRLYEFCQDRVRQGDFDTSLRLLTELRVTWEEVVAREERPAAAPRMELREA